jgi:hypothetical protein
MTKFLSKVLLIVALCVINVPHGFSAGVKFPGSYKAKNQQLVLNGTGVRQKFMIDLFTGGLYLKSKCTDGNKIVNANELMAIKIQVTSDVITSKRLEDNMRSEFKRVTNGNLGPYKARIEELVKAFKEDVNIGDTFDLVYDPIEGLKIYKNNHLKTQVAGLDFKQMVFSTWLGNDPADKDLKKGMLGV